VHCWLAQKIIHGCVVLICDESLYLLALYQDDELAAQKFKLIGFSEDVRDQILLKKVLLCLGLLIKSPSELF